MTKDFDAIVIGSGMGGLTFASLMAQLKGWRVLVLERHFKLGGFTHTFQRPGGYSWDVGLHYVGELAPGSQGRQLMDLVTGGRVAWQPMPDRYDRFVTPEFQFEFVKGEDRLRQALVDAFPAEEAGLTRYFRDVRRTAAWVRRFAVAEALPRPLGAALRALNLACGGLGETRTGAYLDAHFQDPRLKAILACQWGNHGLPPGQSLFATHANIVSHYLDGAWYPVGGAGVIAEAAGAVIRAAGGDLRAGHEVTRVLTEGGRAVGVEVRQREGVQCLRAPVIISDAGGWTTFTRLAKGLVPDLGWDGSGFSVVTLYLGLDRDPRELGFRGENEFITGILDPDAAAASASRLLEGHADACFLSFPSLKDPRAGRHTAEIIAPLPYADVAAFRDQPWRRRGPEYDLLKARMAKALLDLVERHHPGLRSMICYQELSTPLSAEHFTGHPQGGSYGHPGTADRYRKAYLRPRTPLPGLFLTGSDALSFGIMGALMGGVLTASLQLRGAGFLRILREARRREACPERSFPARMEADSLAGPGGMDGRPLEFGQGTGHLHHG